MGIRQGTITSRKLHSNINLQQYCNSISHGARLEFIYLLSLYVYMPALGDSASYQYFHHFF